MQVDSAGHRDDLSEGEDWQHSSRISSSSSSSLPASAMPVTSAMQDLSIERDWDLLSSASSSHASVEGEGAQQPAQHHDVESMFQAESGSRQQERLDLSVLEDWRRITGVASPMTATESEAGVSELSAVSSNASDPIFFPERNATPTNNKRVPQRECSTRHGVLCQLCSEEIRGMRWMCKECPQWSVCTECFVVTAEHEVHPIHTFIRIFSPTDIFKIQEQPSGKTPSIRLGWDVLNQPTIHLEIDCHNCKGSIIGNRYDCVADACAGRNVSLCQDCEALPINSHPPDHPLVKYKLAKESSRPLYVPRDNDGVPNSSSSSSNSNSNSNNQGQKPPAMHFPTAIKRHEDKLSKATLPEERDFYEKRGLVTSKKWMMEEPKQPIAMKEGDSSAAKVPPASWEDEEDIDLHDFWA
jgi:hypothetical protein